MKQNQTFFHGTYSNLTSFFIGWKILKYFNDLHNWHHLNHCKRAEISEMKLNQMERLQIWQYFPYLQRSTLFKWLSKFISWESLSQKWIITVAEKKYYHSVNVKGNGTHLAEKTSRQEAKISTIFRLSWKYFNCIIIKPF